MYFSEYKVLKITIWFWFNLVGLFCYKNLKPSRLNLLNQLLISLSWTIRNVVVTKYWMLLMHVSHQPLIWVLLCFVCLFVSLPLICVHFVKLFKRSVHLRGPNLFESRLLENSCRNKLRFWKCDIPYLSSICELRIWKCVSSKIIFEAAELIIWGCIYSNKPNCQLRLVTSIFLTATIT